MVSAQVSENSYEVLIVGGGMVGAALACCLGNSGIRVAVVEERQPKPFSTEDNPDLRVSAISIATQTIMATVGAWPGVISKRFCPFRRMRVWENNGDTEFCSDDIDRSELGYIVENRVIQLALLDQLKCFDNVDLICPARIEKIQYTAEGSTARLDDGRILTCRLLIAADGAQSRVRQTVGMGVSSWDYDQHAMVISVETGYSQRDITWQRFTPSGPQAFLPLFGNRASLVWYNSPDEIRRLKLLANTELITELATSFPGCLGEIKAILGKASFPLKRQHAFDYVKTGVALIGDAAHVINPLAGQGVNIGFLDAAALAQVLVDAQEKDQDLGSICTLQEYQRLRRRENLVMMTAIEMFYRVFSNRILPLKAFRNFGLGLAQRLQPAKNKVMRYAIGLEGNLPKLAKGEMIIGEH